MEPFGREEIYSDKTLGPVTLQLQEGLLEHLQLHRRDLRSITDCTACAVLAVQNTEEYWRARIEGERLEEQES